MVQLGWITFFFMFQKGTNKKESIAVNWQNTSNWMLFTSSLENAKAPLTISLSLKISQIGKIAFAAQTCAKKITLEVFNPGLHVRITWELKKIFLLMWNSCNIKSTILSEQVSGILHIHDVVQPPSLSSPKAVTFLSRAPSKPHPLSSFFPFFLSPQPWQPLIWICLQDWYILIYPTYGIVWYQTFMFGFLYLVSCVWTFIHVVTCVSKYFILTSWVTVHCVYVRLFMSIHQWTFWANFWHVHVLVGVAAFSTCSSFSCCVILYPVNDTTLHSLSDEFVRCFQHLIFIANIAVNVLIQVFWQLARFQGVYLVMELPDSRECAFSS